MAQSDCEVGYSGRRPACRRKTRRFCTMLVRCLAVPLHQDTSMYCSEQVLGSSRDGRCQHMQGAGLHGFRLQELTTGRQVARSYPWLL